MSEEFTGVSDQGTGEVQSTESAPQVDAPQVGTDSTDAPEQLDEKSAGIMRELAETREKLRRQEEYNGFLKGLSNAPVKQQIQMPDLDDEQVPYVGDVKSLIKAEMQMAREEARLEALVGELKQTGDKLRASDSNFDGRMGLANEILKYKPEYEVLINSQTSAEGIVRIMENIAMEHPMYANYSAKATAPAGNQEIIDRLKANAQIPQTLSGVQNSGSATKLPSQMTDEEYFKYKEEIKKRA